MFPEVELLAHVRDTGRGPGSLSNIPLVLGKRRKSPPSRSPVIVSINKHIITVVSDKGRGTQVFRSQGEAVTGHLLGARREPARE